MQMNNDFSKRQTMIENFLSKLGNIKKTRSRAAVSRIKTHNLDLNRRLIETEISCQTNIDLYDDSENSSQFKQNNKY